MNVLAHRRESDLGPWLEGLRTAAGLNKTEAAEAIGVNVRSVRRWENDGLVPNGLDLLRCLSAYGVKLSRSAPEMPMAVNAELAAMSATLEEIRDGVAVVQAGTAIGRSQILLKLLQSGTAEQARELRQPLLLLARREREAGELMIEQAGLLEDVLLGL